MVKSFNEEVLMKVDEIVACIRDSDTYKRYQQLSSQMKKDDEIMGKINAIKDLQKQIVRRQAQGMACSELETKISTLLKELESNPLYLEHSYLLEDLNETLQNIKFIIEKYLNEKIN